MGFFSKLFGKKDKKDDGLVFYAKQDERMQAAVLDAQKNFKYFWRALYWEYRRIVPAHNFAMIKMPFTQKVPGQKDPLVEHMWINNIQFDGELITGELVNDPNQLTIIAKGDPVSRKVEKIGDWMISIQGEILGGFSIQAMRTVMSVEERAAHDQAWGIDFGNPNEVLLSYQQKEHPENLVEHPMAKNMKEKYREFLAANPKELTHVNEKGFTILHNEAIAGNKTTIELLLEFGADKTLKTNLGKTAYDYAKTMGWSPILELLK